MKISWSRLSDFANISPKGGVSVSRAKCNHCKTNYPQWNASNLSSYRVNDKKPATGNKTLDGLAEWCAMPKGEPQNLIAWCVKRFADFTDYIDYDQYFSHLNHAKFILYSTVACPVTSFPCDMRAIHMVHCTRSTSWTKHKPPRNDTVLLKMGTSPDSH